MISKELVKVNCMRILELLEIDGIEQRSFEVEGKYYTEPNPNNIELRQRLKMLRKETLLLERKI